MLPAPAAVPLGVRSWTTPQLRLLIRSMISEGCVRSNPESIPARHADGGKAHTSKATRASPPGIHGGQHAAAPAARPGRGAHAGSHRAAAALEGSDRVAVHAPAVQAVARHQDSVPPLSTERRSGARTNAVVMCFLISSPAGPW